MNRMARTWAGTVVAGVVVACLASAAWANVYPSGVSIDAASFNTLTGTAKISYRLNENADGDGVNPGVKIEVLDGATPVRTVSILRQLQGLHHFEWDGRDDAGARVPNKDYTVRITASDFGYTGWTQISVDGPLNSFYVPVGVSVNKNPASPNYGKIYVSEGLGGTPGVAPTRGTATSDGIYMLYADGSDAGFSNGGLTWPGTHSPFKTTIGPDDHLYVSDLANDLAFEFSADMTTATPLITAANRSANQWVHSILVEGTQAEGNRKIYLTNGNYDDTARKGLIGYDLGAASAATGTGFQVVAASYFTYYAYDFARDSAGDWYCCQYRYTPNQAPPLSKFLDTTYPITEAEWEASGDYTGAYGMDIDEPRARVAYGDYYTGIVRVFDLNTGAFLSQFTNGTRAREVAFDAAGNLYVVDNNIERLRIWSPPDGINSMDVTTAAITLNKPGSGGPVITAHPADVAVCPGSNAMFSVTATGGTLAYQWKKNGVDLSGQTSASLTLSSVQAADDGAVITCVVSDANGVAVSNPAVLTIGVAFLEAPLSQTICQNTDAVFTVTALNASGYQWERAANATPNDFSPIVGATDPTLTLTSVPATDNGTRIRCSVSSPCGSAMSPVATLTIRTGPTIGNVATSYVTPNPRPTGSGATFYAIVVSSTGPVTHQWKRNGEDLVNGAYPWGVVSGATSPNLALSELTCDASGSFTVAITDECGTRTSVCNAAPGTTGQSCYLTMGTGSETADPAGGSAACSNGIDDDCDGLIDCDDPGCDGDFNCGAQCNTPFADADMDTDVDMDDFAFWQRCYTGNTPNAIPADPEYCACMDYTNDGLINEADLVPFVNCGSGPGVAALDGCDDRPGGAGKVVINEFVYDLIDGSATNLTDQREFIELYNRSGESVDISGWIVRCSDTDTNRAFLIPGGVGSNTTVMAPGGFYVISNSNVPVPSPNPPQFGWLEITDSITDVLENGPDALELLDANRDTVDVVVYNRAVDGTVSAGGKGAIWGDLDTFDGGNPMLSVSRWLDGLDSEDNGRDFGMRPWTPGTSNQAGASLISAYALPNIDALAAGSVVDNLYGAFQQAIVIDPTNAGTMVNDAIVNPNAITASPQGGKAVVVWDFVAGGGNMAVSRDIMNNGGSMDLYVYLDTSFAAWGEDVGSESTGYGILGTTDPIFAIPDPDGSVVGDTRNVNGSTGLAWVFNKRKVDENTTICKLYMVDAGPGGDSSPPASPWVVHATIDMSAQPSGWYRLKIAYDKATGAVTASGAGQSLNFTTVPGLTGGFYVGYREALPGVPTYGRPATFDSAQ